MIVVTVFRPELRDEDDESPFEGYEIVGVRPNDFLANALIQETCAKAKEIGQNVDGWSWLLCPVSDADPPYYTWTGWLTADDTGDGDTPDGYEWLSIDEDGEEYAIVPLRTKASIFTDKPDDLTAARAAREIRANAIVRALNAAVARGEIA